MEAVAPVTAELWERLRRLDRRCEISLVRTAPACASPWAHLPKVWVATIREKQSIFFDIAQASHPVFAEAVKAAVEIAEGKGWQQAKER